MNPNLPNSFRTGPDERGHFGIFGGRFVAETLMPLILDLEKAYADAKADPAFQAEMNGYLKHYVGRPSPLYLAERLTEHLGGAKIYFKREELNHTGSHKVNNVLVTFAYKSQYQKEIAELVTCITKNVDGLQVNGHPKWRDVDPLDIDRVKWPVHPAALAAIKKEAKKK